MSNLRKRILTALVGAPLLIGALLLGSWALLLLVLAACLQSQSELRSFYLQKKVEFAGPWVVAYVLALPLAIFFIQEDYLFVLGLVSLLWFTILLIREIFSQRQEVLAAIGAAFLTGLFSALPFSSLLALQMLIEGRPGWRSWLLMVLAATWATDTFAYFGGRAFGKRKLLERVSPNKTVEGFLSGFLGSIVLCLLFGFLTDSLSLQACLGAGFVIGLLGPMGDLIESRLKRDAALKDSGAIIPGHGGILDRFDSWILVMPVLYLLVRFHWLPL